MPTGTTDLARGAALALAACGDPGPPLLDRAKAPALTALPSPYAGLDGETRHADLMILRTGAPLRARLRQRVLAIAADVWRPRVLGEPRVFGKYGAPSVACPDKPDGDTDVCTLVFSPAPSRIAAMPALAPRLSQEDVAALAAGAMEVPQDGSPVTVSFRIDDGTSGPFRQGLPGAPDTDRTVGIRRLDVERTYPGLGRQAVVCRLGAFGGAERRACSLEFGPTLLTVQHDTSAGATPLSGLDGNPELAAALGEGARLLVILLGDPVLMRALPPARDGEEPAAVLMQAVNGNGAAFDDAATVRRLTVTLDRPDLSRKLVLAPRPRKLPDVLSVDEVARLLGAAPGIKYRAALAYNSCRNRHCPLCQGAAAHLARRARGRPAAGRLLPRRLHAADRGRRHRAPEQGGGVRPAVPGGVRDDDDHRR